MPELPEVEITRRQLASALTGATVVSTFVGTQRLRQAVPQDLANRLPGKRLSCIDRRGKYLLFDFQHQGKDAHLGLLIHLGMSGCFRLAHQSEPIGRHMHFAIQFKMDSKQPATPDIFLRFYDPRRFGLIDWLPPAVFSHRLLARLGKEPFADDFSADWLYSQLRKRSGPIKPVLMDSHLLVGVGNIYAAESLFRARISPMRRACTLSRAQCLHLVDAIRITLQNALTAGGSSLRDFTHSDGQLGYFQLQCAVYGRQGQPCPRCNHPIKQLRQAGRSTFFCSRCQH